MRALLCLLGALALPAWAGWQWEAPLDVSTTRGANIFPHLESANRQGVAAAQGAVAVVWEDNRSGGPRCYAAIRPAGAAAFLPEFAFDTGQCYEPVVAPLDNGRFLAAWEEAGHVWTRVLPDGNALRLDTAGAAQVTLASGGSRIHAAWAEQAGRFRHIVVATLKLDDGQIAVEAVQPVEAARPIDEQAWPALVASGEGVVVAWEDRRDRHTVPRVSRGDAKHGFSASVPLTDPQPRRADGLGAGQGAMRPTLATWGDSVVAVWLDKRDFLSGYDVYAAFEASGRFGKNLRVQDSFGDATAQWHARVAAGAGRLLAVWDDARDGSPDVWLANWEGAAFGDNLAVPAASGPGEQREPVAWLDETGALHLVWLDRTAAGTRVRYARAVWK